MVSNIFLNIIVWEESTVLNIGAQVHWNQYF